jgi:fatty-acyl-CoA synthase
MKTSCIDGGSTLADRYIHNPARWVSQWCDRDPAQSALTSRGRTLTYRELDRLAAQGAAILRGLGAVAGSRIAFMGQNEPDLAVIALAAWRIGACVVPLNYRLTVTELVPLLADATPHVVFAGEGHMDLLAAASRALDRASPLPVAAIRAGTGPESGKPGNVACTANQGSAPGALLYTSGTTGTPKGVVWTFANIYWAVTAELSAARITGADVNLITGPMVMAGPLLMLLCSFASGGHVVLMGDRFEPAAALEAVTRHGVTLGATSPLILRMLTEVDGFVEADLSSLRCFVVGGGPVPTDVMTLFTERGVGMTQGYGMTETTGVGTFLPPGIAASKLGSAGPAVPMVEIRIADPNAGSAPSGVVGEILVRGPNVMAGYWGQPDLTAEIIDSDGWLHTGDAGCLDPDGHLYVVDRIKDMIISGGLNVYAAEVERVLLRHPGVHDVAVIGIPDQNYGELVTAVVEKEVGQEATLDGLRDLARADLAGYKLPRRLILVDQLPRNANGKVRKAVLRAEAAD